MVGENGAGKSTLVKILTGVEAPDAGEILIKGVRASQNAHVFDKIAYVPQELTLFPDLTVAENLFMPFSKSGLTAKFLTQHKLNKAALPFLEAFALPAEPSQKVRMLSVSDQQLLQLARAATKRDLEILILDEPTTSLTNRETDRLFEIIRRLRKQGKGIVFISHKLEEILGLGDFVTVLRNGEKVGESEMSKIDSPWIVGRMCGEELDLEENCQPAAQESSTILSVSNLSGEHFRNVSFSLQRSEVLGFAGLVGAGRSEVMQTLYGFVPKTSGSAVLEGRPWKFKDTNWAVRHGVIYLSEERKLHGILPSESVRHNIGISLLKQTAPQFLISGRREKLLVKSIVADYDIRTPSIEDAIMHLSGGNQQKAIVGRSMAIRPKILIFDEPTKGIDIRTKTYIYHLVKRLAEDERLGIILISSELEELLKCANRIITMYAGAISGQFQTRTTTREQLLKSIIGISGDAN